MFQITRRVDYATRIMLELGGHPEGTWAQARHIARATGVSRAFLHKITADLVKDGLVRTYPGPTGGLALSRPAATINMLHILEAIDGPICLNVCLLRPRECRRDLTCPAHSFWGRLQASLIQQLQSATLDALVAEARLLKGRPRRAAIQYVLLEAIPENTFQSQSGRA